MLLPAGNFTFFFFKITVIRLLEKACSKNVLKVKEYIFGNLHTLLCLISAFVLDYCLLFMLIFYTGNYIRNNIFRTTTVPS